MKYALLLLVSLSMLLTGCTTSDYERYALMQESIAASESRARIAEAKVAEVAVQTGSDVVKAVGLLRFGANGQTKSAVTLQAPRSFGDQVFQWAGLLVPTVMQGYGIHANMRTSMNASDNATTLGVSTNNAFVGMASQIQAPAPNMTIGGNGVIGSGSFRSEVIGGNGASGGSSYVSNPVSNSYNPVDNSQRNPVDNTNQGNPIDNSNQGNPVNNSNQGNPITNP